MASRRIGAVEAGPRGVASGPGRDRPSRPGRRLGRGRGSSSPGGHHRMPSGWREPHRHGYPHPSRTERTAFSSRLPGMPGIRGNPLPRDDSGQGAAGQVDAGGRDHSLAPAPRRGHARAWAALWSPSSRPLRPRPPRAERLLRAADGIGARAGRRRVHVERPRGRRRGGRSRSARRRPVAEPVSASASSPAAASTASPTIADTADDRPDRPRRADDDGDVAAADGDSSGPVAQGAQTEWGGLLFLLSLAPAVGLPHDVIAEPAWQPLPAVGAAARRGHAGLPPPTMTPRWRPSPDSDRGALAVVHREPSTAVERQSVRRLGDRWARAVTEALGCPDAEPRRRQGHVFPSRTGVITGPVGSRSCSRSTRSTSTYASRAWTWTRAGCPGWDASCDSAMSDRTSRSGPRAPRPAASRTGDASGRGWRS